MILVTWRACQVGQKYEIFYIPSLLVSNNWLLALAFQQTVVLIIETSVFLLELKVLFPAGILCL
jgi:hypothetical protein